MTTQTDATKPTVHFFIGHLFTLWETGDTHRETGKRLLKVMGGTS